MEGGEKESLEYQLAKLRGPLQNAYWSSWLALKGEDEIYEISDV